MTWKYTKPTEVKLRAGGFKYPVTLDPFKDRLVLKFGYSPKLLAEVKSSFEGRKYHGFDTADPPKGKWWSIPYTDHNAFQLAYMMGENPYAPYETELPDFESKYPLYSHQKEMAAHVLERRHCILGAEMGTGKTLTIIAAVEQFDPNAEMWYVAPAKALEAVKREFIKWKTPLKPKFMTYEGMKKEVMNWTNGRIAPKVLIFDESSRAKNPKAQRTQCAQALADAVRADHGRDSLIVPMSGSPAPKAPTDWFSQCKIACPGFLREGRYYDFEHRLSLITQQQSLEGVSYPERVCWLDDEKRCAECGKPEDHSSHQRLSHPNFHSYQKSINEIAKLYRRMKGLVDIKFKKDCLDLPDKIYTPIILEPSKEISRLAKLVELTSTTAIQTLTKLRELSDGFQYIETPIGAKTCEGCNGTKQILEWYDPNDPDSSVNPHDIDNCPPHEVAKRFKQELVECPNCNGSGEQTTFKRDVKEINTPKIEALKGELDLHDDVGRIVIYAAFFGSIDRIVREVNAFGWHCIRVDGRGWHVTSPDGMVLDIDPLTMFQDNLIKYPRVAFVGQPGAAGMGLTLTASPTIVYYSNDFNAESRIQSEDRIHRIGMDKNRGATIKDFICLPTDQLVLDNLKKKKRLQSMTMGEIKEVLKSVGVER
jgi:SNF2 family DNA or RNA helicase